METGINHRPCPSREQGEHEAALRLLPLGWKRLVQTGLTLSEQLGGRKIAQRREGGRVSGGECMEPNHLPSYCELETRYG